MIDLHESGQITERSSRDYMKNMFLDEKNKPISKRFDRDQMNLVWSKIFNQEIFKYGAGNIFKYFFSCIWCRSARRIRD